MISTLLAPFRNLSVNVEIDPLLLPYLDCPDNHTVNRTLTVNLFKLIYVIGTIQSRRFAPSKRQKFTDKSDLLEKLDVHAGEFRVRISNVRGTLGSEVLTTISEDFGVGLSVMIASQLFNVKDSTIERIPGNDLRPDWRCQTQQNRLLVVESKGSSTESGSRTQERRAIQQKARRQADIRVASLAVIREHSISTTRFVDPPGEEPQLDAESQRQVLRAGHYASVFSFLGHASLSRYFTQMRKRILKTISRREQHLKDIAFREILDDYTRIDFRNNAYAGTFYETNERQYIFVGVDVNLIYYEGFLEFNDSDEDVEEELEGNHFVRFKDGILVVEIDNIQYFSESVFVPSILNYQQFTTISDIDAMTEISLEKYWLYVLKQNGFTTATEVRHENSTLDVVALFDDRRYIFELKIFKRRQMTPAQAEQIFDVLHRADSFRAVLVTNAKVPISGMYARGVILIGRDQLQQISKEPQRLMQFLDV